MKLYTAIGDRGTTLLVGGGRTDKSGVRIDAYGCVDELNAQLGLFLAAVSGDPHAMAARAIGQLVDQATLVQHELFNIGSELATPREALDSAPLQLIDHQHVRRLEHEIDAMSDEVPPLSAFVLPGGTELGARAHVCRTVCRRAERAVWRLHATEPVREATTIYLNRLSDWLFAAARLVIHAVGADEVLWDAKQAARATPTPNA